MPLRYFLPLLPTALLFVMLLSASSQAVAEDTELDRQTLFQREGHNTYRIPSIVLTAKGTVLAFTGKRKGSSSDFGHPTDVVLRRSTDGGKNFGPPVTIATAPETDIHSGPVVIDRHSQRIFKFCRYWPAGGKPRETVYQTPYSEMRRRGLIDHLIISSDDGQTWTDPKPLPLPYPDDAVSCGTGNGNHGIQLADGRLLIQGAYVPRSGPHADQRVMCVFLSDDRGETWRMGAAAPSPVIREYTLAQLADGSIYYNFRNGVKGVIYRWVGRHESPGEVFPELVEDKQLYEPRCHAGLAFAPPTEDHPQGALLFSNPRPMGDDNTFLDGRRRDLSILASLDGGRTWPILRQIDRRPAAYSDLATDGRTVHCLFETGERNCYERMDYLQLPLEQLLACPSPHPRAESKN